MNRERDIDVHMSRRESGKDVNEAKKGCVSDDAWVVGCDVGMGCLRCFAKL